MAESSVLIRQFDPATGKLKTVTKENSDNFAGVDWYSLLPNILFHANLEVPAGKDKLILIKLDKKEWEEKVAFETMHLSRKSDTYQNGHQYGGVIIYLYNGKSDWKTANNTQCKSGYIVIQDTDSENVKQWRNEPGVVHGAVYRNAFGESVNEAEVVGEGFSFRKKFEMISRTLNKAKDDSDQFHDDRETMNKASVHCVRKIVTDYWKDGGSSYIGHTFKVKDLLEGFKSKL